MKIPVYILMLMMCVYTAHSQSAPSDTVVTNRLNKIIKVNTESNRSLKTLVIKSDSIKRAVISRPPVHPCIDCVTKPDFIQWLLILLPVILFILLLWYFLRWLKKDNYKIADALSVDMSDEQVEQLQRTSLATGEAPQQPVLKRSSSRLIAFFSGLSAVIIAICITSYYMYFAIKGLAVPKFEELWPILASLGIGVVPYATKIINEKK
jgi:ATP-dependent Zn protease